jgi:hypothetical protein
MGVIGIPIGVIGMPMGVAGTPPVAAPKMRCAWG